MEHYRPKGKVLEDDGTERPGYAWLKLEWTNLLPSCIDCNSERRQERVLPTGRRIASKAGKACKFPLRDPKRRARKRGEEQREEALLLNPCEDEEPMQHIAFTDNGSIAARIVNKVSSDRGLATIQVVGLDRSGLVEWRRRRLLELERQMNEVCRNSAGLIHEPANAAYAAGKKSALENLRHMAHVTNSYSGMAEQVIQHFERVLDALERYLRVELDLDQKRDDPQAQEREAQALAELAALSPPDHPLRKLTRRVHELMVGTLPALTPPSPGTLPVS